MTIAGGSAVRAKTYKGYVLRMRRDKNTRIVEIFGPACSDIALSTAASVAAANKAHTRMGRFVIFMLDSISGSILDSTWA